jgi:UDP-N-acetylglucosamine 4,6-dehydratase
VPSAYDGKTVLVTGGTGSFGRTVIRRALGTDVAEVRVFSRDEAKQDEMRHSVGDGRVRYYIGDVRNRDSVRQALSGVDYVFHAAALKQVPSCEFFPMEAVRTNVEGSRNVIDCAEENGVKSLVCLSTDKAVYPVNAMGMSKALMEKLARAHARACTNPETIVSSVRYGNVMYSRGSVIPLFVRKIFAGEALPITKRSMTRFMMTLQESVDLVEYCFEHAEQGDIFIQKAPACTIEELALALCRVFGVEPVIQDIGIRHGEKLHETLATREELAIAFDHGKYLRLPVDARELQYDTYVDRGMNAVQKSQDFDSDNVTRMTPEELSSKLLDVPEVCRALVEFGRDVDALREEFSIATPVGVL